MRHIKKIKLSAFLDGEVSPEERAEIVEHLKFCPFCRREAEELSRVSDFLGFVEDVEVSPYFFVRLKQRITREKSKAVIRLPFKKWARRYHFERIVFPLGVTACLFFSCLIGSYLGKTIYTTRMEIEVEVSDEFADVLSMEIFDSHPEGSLSSAYNNLLLGEENE